jgi:hypothetical protein
MFVSGLASKKQREYEKIKKNTKLKKKSYFCPIKLDKNGE